MSLRVPHFQNETNASCPDLCGQGYRANFHTHSAAKGLRKKIYHGHLEGSGPRKGEHAVVKMFRDGPGTEPMCDAEIEKHRLALKLARRFNKLVSDPRAKISFTLPLKSTVESLAVGQFLTRHRHGRHLDKREWVLIEENLIRQGEYQVFIGKAGETLDKSPTALDAFLHFTYHESGRKFVLCGFQGIQTEKGYILTTPCIHSEDSSFGPVTDGGPKTMLKVFERHVCNNLCYSYERPRLPSQDDQMPQQENGQGKTASDNEDDEDGGLFLTPARDSKSDVYLRQRSGSDDENGDDDDNLFKTHSATELRVMVESADLNSGEHDNSTTGFHHKVFSLGKEAETSEDLAYCCTDLSKSVIEEIEEVVRRAEEKRAENNSTGKISDHDLFKRIHLGDQIKPEEKPGGHKKEFDSDELMHRCNVQAVGGIEKRPSI
ncbi:hypothetical protein EGW08_011616 [Elysia chlorotica]|uniref:Alpha-type protein kinase domain-containing protein n=1 Tax=Elysia chlorotica TaxID=188477 RepID=A0A433TGE1_ELYCH|nr:hypothetical protein EGW08_011616 [Elysia chlorotica]